MHKESILDSKEDRHWVRRKFSGKPARGLANRFMRAMREAPQLPFPAQAALTPSCGARQRKPTILISLRCGRAGGALSRALPGAELVAALEAETWNASTARRLAALGHAERSHSPSSVSPRTPIGGFLER